MKQSGGYRYWIVGRTMWMVTSRAVFSTAAKYSPTRRASSWFNRMRPEPMASVMSAHPSVIAIISTFLRRGLQDPRTRTRRSCLHSWPMSAGTWCEALSLCGSLTVNPVPGPSTREIVMTNLARSYWLKSLVLVTPPNVNCLPCGYPREVNQLPDHLSHLSYIMRRDEISGSRLGGST